MSRVLRGIPCRSDQEFKYVSHTDQSKGLLSLTLDDIKHLKENLYQLYNLDSLTQDSVKYLYQQRLDGSLIASPQQSAGRGVRNNVWWYYEIEDFVNKKREMHLRWLTTKDGNNKQKYNEVKRQVRRTSFFCRAVRQEQSETKCATKKHTLEKENTWKPGDL